MSLFFKDVIAAFSEAIHLYDRAEYRALPIDNETFRTVLLFLWIGAVFAFCVSYYNNHYLGAFVEKLILSGATEKDKAKTLRELSLDKKRMLKHSLRAGSPLRRCVLAQGDELPPTSEFYKGIGTSESESYKKADEQEASGKAVLQAEAERNATEKEDIDAVAFYIPEQLLGKARTRYRKQGNSAVMLVVSILASALAVLLLAIYAPLILGFIDGSILAIQGIS